MDLDSLQLLLTRFSPITLDEMKSVRLMDRIDTKYVIPYSALHSFLERLQGDFLVQSIGDERLSHYETLYFDTSATDLYRIHQCGKLCRQKIRIRNYIDTDNSFLEVKNKNNKGRTRKLRVACTEGILAQLSSYQSFLDDISIFPVQDLSPHLKNRFSRITLINSNRTERLTIDLEVSFYNQRSGHSAELNRLVIIELKQQGNCHSIAKEILHKHRIRAMGFSKYCVGCALTAPNLPVNRLKKKLRFIHKLVNTNIHDTNRFS